MGIGLVASSQWSVVSMFRIGCTDIAHRLLITTDYPLPMLISPAASHSPSVSPWRCSVRHLPRHHAPPSECRPSRPPGKLGSSRHLLDVPCWCRTRGPGHTSVPKSPETADV